MSLYYKQSKLNPIFYAFPRYPHAVSSQTRWADFLSPLARALDLVPNQEEPEKQEKNQGELKEPETEYKQRGEKRKSI